MNGPVPFALRVAKFSSRLVRSAALRAVLLGPGLRQDGDLRQLVDEDRIRVAGLELDLEIAELAHLLERGEMPLEVRALAGRARDREQDVVGREGAAVVELHARPELHADDRRLHVAPAGGERRLELQRAVAPDQRLVDAVREREQERLVARVRIHRVRIAVISEAQRLSRDGCRRDRRGDQRRRRSAQEAEPDAHGPAFLSQEVRIVARNRATSRFDNGRQSRRPTRQVKA
jgi:hypothetical protein